MGTKLTLRQAKAVSVRRGEVYRLRAMRGDPRRSRPVVIVSREEFIETPYSSVVCVPAYTRATGLATEVAIGAGEGLAHDSFLRCDELTSVRRELLTGYVGSLGEAKLLELARAMALALGIEAEDLVDSG